MALEFYPGGECQSPVTPAVVPDCCPLARRLSNASVDTIYSRPVSLGNQSVEQAAAAAVGDTAVWPAGHLVTADTVIKFAVVTLEKQSS